jgi:aspartyl-tRNA(Asn)/glutamyl-tRNA(Gln) amidotransferase subunit A
MQVADVEEVALPDLPYVAVASTILGAEIGSSFDDFTESGRLSELTAPEGRYKPYARTALLAVDYLRALRLRREMGRQIDALLSRYDAFVAPTSGSVAPPIHPPAESDEQKDRSPDFIGAIGNGCGLPAITVPSGLSQDGLPTGIEFLGRAYEENTVLAVARAYQGLTDWHNRHPAGLSP